MSHRFFLEAQQLMYEHTSTLSFSPIYAIPKSSPNPNESTPERSESTPAYTQVAEIPKKVDSLYLTMSKVVSCTLCNLDQTQTGYG